MFGHDHIEMPKHAVNRQIDRQTYISTKIWNVSGDVKVTLCII